MDIQSNKNNTETQSSDLLLKKKGKLPLELHLDTRWQIPLQ